MRVVAMFRVSTEKQANEGASLDAQEHGYRGLADRHGWDTVAVFRGCESATQASRERAVLQQVLACVRERRPEAIYVHEQSRLTRGDELEVAALLRELREQEIKIIIGGVVRDLSSLDERFMVGIQSLVDRAEAERIKERHLRGKRAKARRGLKNSGPTPFGYRNPPPGHPDRGQLQIVEDEAVIVRRVFAMAADGDAVRAIAARLNAEGVPSPRGKHWGKSSIARMLANPAYRGCHVTGGWVAEPGSRTFRFDQNQPGAIVVEGSHQPIVSPAAWEAAQPTRPAPPTPRPRLLSGLMTMNGHPATGDSLRRRSFYRPPRGARGGPWIPVEAADSVVWRAFVQAISEPSFLERVVAEVRVRQEEQIGHKEGPSLTARIEKLEARLARLVDMRADGDITGEEFRQRSSDAREQARAARQRLAVVEQLEARGDGQWVRKAFAAVRLLVVAERALSSEERRRVLHRTVRHVSVKARRIPVAQAKDEQGRYGKVSRSPWLIESVTFDLALGSPRGDGDLDTSC
tara:strand:+ start:34857 stop:36413 length:1557 start_codon:yes stop_codon:yes gene_type:complete